MKSGRVGSIYKSLKTAKKSKGKNKGKINGKGPSNNITKYKGKSKVKNSKKIKKQSNRKTQKKHKKVKSKKHKHKLKKTIQSGGLNYSQPIDISKKGHLQYFKRDDQDFYWEFLLPHLDAAIFQKLVNDNKIEIYNEQPQGILGRGVPEQYLKFKDATSLLCKKNHGSSMITKTASSKDKHLVEVLFDPTPEVSDIKTTDQFLTFKCKSQNPTKEFILKDNIQWFLRNLNEINKPETTCEKGDFGLPEEYKKFIIKRDIGEFKIIIYPDPNPKEWRTWLFEEGDFYQDIITTIFGKHKDDEYFNNLLKDLYNAFESVPSNISNISDILTNVLKNKIKQLKSAIDILEESVENKVTLKSKLDTFVEQKITSKLQLLFNQPNCCLKFVTLVLKKKDGSDEYEQMVNHLSQVGPQHTTILKELQTILDVELPALLEYKTPNINYLAYSLPGFFYLKVLYFHPTQTSFGIPSYQIQNMITLSEIIFGSTLGGADSTYFSKVKRHYYVHNYQLEQIPTEGGPAGSVIPPPSLIPINNATTLMLVRTPVEPVENIFSNAEIIMLHQGIVHSSISIYLKTSDDKFYFVELEPILNQIKDKLIKTTIGINSSPDDNLVYKCDSDSVYSVRLDAPVYKIKKKVRISGPSLQIPNILKKKHDFPTMINEMNFNEIDAGFEGKDLMTYYPMDIKNKKYKNDPDPRFESNPGLLNAGIALRSDDDYKQPLKKIKIEIEIDTKTHTYILVVVKDNSPVIKKVVWIIKTEKGLDDEDYKTSIRDRERLKDLYDLKGIELNKIIEVLKRESVYDSNTEFLGINNIISVDMNILHLHIIPKTSAYESIITTKDVDISSELRMKNALNINENLLAYPDFYVKFKEANIENRILSSIKFGLR